MIAEEAERYAEFILLRFVLRMATVLGHKPGVFSVRGRRPPRQSVRAIHRRLAGRRR